MSIKHFLQLNYFLNGIPTKVLVQKQKLCYKLPTQKSQATEEKSRKQMKQNKTKSINEIKSRGKAILLGK